MSVPAVFVGHVARGGAHVSRRRKARPVDPFTGEDKAVHLDDCLLSLRRASMENG